MIIKPGISTLEKCVEDGCRYILVTMAAKRARMIGESGEGLAEADSKKAVSLAVAEIEAGKVGYTKVKDEEITEETEAVEA
ncbi:MAG: DNA-directed RNA polymerase subunit omega [Clostridia bacterium]|nr:DNA-directed RNA polymerase subunit omega [Clostridia bacterium]